jgi:hypothetical protein
MLLADHLLEPPRPHAFGQRGIGGLTGTLFE